MKKILIGIIGLGNIGKKRLDSINKIKNLAEVKIICEKKKNIKKKFKNIKITNDIKKINNYNLDLLIICTPTAVSSKIYNQLVGKYHLLIEKPITLDSKKLLKNVKKSTKQKKIIKAGYNLKYDLGLQFIKKDLQANHLRQIYYCKICYGNGTAKSNTNNVGSIFDMASHSINLLMWLFNSNVIKIINSTYQKNEFSKIYPDNGFAILKIKNILVSLHHSFCSWKNKFSLEIYGKKGSLKAYSLPKWSDQIITKEERVFPSGKPKIKIKRFKHDLSFKNELYSLLKTIKNINNINHRVIKEINYECYYTLKNSNLLK